MANLNFFATCSDLERVFAFIYGDTDFRVYESYSEFGQELREYKSLEKLAAAYDLGQDPRGNGHAVLLQMWSPTVMSTPAIERIALDPRKCGGFTFRYRIGGYGLAQLYLGGLCKRVVTQTHYGHFSERGAAKWGDTSQVDWKALQKLSGRFQRHVSRNLAVAKAPGHPVLADAFERFNAGYELKLAAQTPWAYTAVTGGSA